MLFKYEIINVCAYSFAYNTLILPGGFFEKDCDDVSFVYTLFRSLSKKKLGHHLQIREIESDNYFTTTFFLFETPTYLKM